MASYPLIVMMTDFGTEHWYDAAMKGEILRRVPDAMILDLSHHVPRQSIEIGAFMLHCAIDSFPRQTIFCCVVDPGVGGPRRGMVGWVGEYGYVGPDNGLVTPLLERGGDTFTLHEIKSPIFRNTVVSPTFHGRDVFAPAAARLLLGDDPRMAGPRVTDPIRLDKFEAASEGKHIVGKVMLVDHFGNVVTNIDHEIHSGLLSEGGFEIKVGSLRIWEINTFYGEKKAGEPVCYWGSSGFLEAAVTYGSAAQRFGIKVGDPVVVTLK